MSDCPDPWEERSKSNWPLVIITGIVAAAIICIIDFLFYGLLAPDFVSYPGMRETPDMTNMMIGYCLGGLLFAYIYVIWWCPIPIPWWKKGCYFGALLGVIVFLPAAFFNSALFEGWNLSDGLKQVVYQVIQFAIVGMMIGWMIRKFGKSKSAED